MDRLGWALLREKPGQNLFRKPLSVTPCVAMSHFRTLYIGGNKPSCAVLRGRDAEMKLYRVSEASEITSLSLATWRSWILHRRVEVVRLGRSVRISQEELDRIVREGTTPARRAETGHFRRRGTVPAA